MWRVFVSLRYFWLALPRPFTEYDDRIFARIIAVQLSDVVFEMTSDYVSKFTVAVWYR